MHHQMHAPIHPPACSAPNTNPAPSCCLPVPPDACRRHTLRFLTVYITFLPFAFWCVCSGGGALGCAGQLYHALQLGQSLLQPAMLTLARPCFLSPAIPAPFIFRHLPFLPPSLDPRPIFGWATLPVMGVLTFLLAGVENVGTQTEEPSRWAGATAATRKYTLPIPSCSGNYTCPKPAQHIPLCCRILPLNQICAATIRAVGLLLSDYQSAAGLAASAADVAAAAAACSGDGHDACKAASAAAPPAAVAVQLDGEANGFSPSAAAGKTPPPAVVTVRRGSAGRQQGSGNGSNGIDSSGGGWMRAGDADGAAAAGADSPRWPAVELSGPSGLATPSTARPLSPDPSDAFASA